MKKQKIKIEAVYWRDAHTFGDWTDEKEAIKFAEDSWNQPNISFGKILKENRKYVILTASIQTNKLYFGDLTMIPKALIIKRKNFNF